MFSPFTHLKRKQTPTHLERSKLSASYSVDRLAVLRAVSIQSAWLAECGRTQHVHNRVAAVELTVTSLLNDRPHHPSESHSPTQRPPMRLVCDVQSEAVRTAPSLALHVVASQDSTGTLELDDSTVRTRRSLIRRVRIPHSAHEYFPTRCELCSFCSSCSLHSHRSCESTSVHPLG
jgi:hypothetical protein